MLNKNNVSGTTLNTSCYTATRSHLQQEDDTDNLSAATRDWLKEPGAGQHLAADDVHAGAREGLLKHRLHGQHTQVALGDRRTTLAGRVNHCSWKPSENLQAGISPGAGLECKPTGGISSGAGLECKPIPPLRALEDFFGGPKSRRHREVFLWGIVRECDSTDLSGLGADTAEVSGLLQMAGGRVCHQVHWRGTDRQTHQDERERGDTHTHTP